MRFFKIILAVYIVTLSLVPCSDGIGKSHDETANIEASTHSDAEYPDHAETCTPFCNCTCCGFAFMISGDTFSFESQTFSSIEFFHKNGTLLSLSYSIWLPPKI
ncbi:MAG TPA: DUF6660 family protein [Cytophagaceae bacterium]|jgi:hypothetical protein|nr:DUF6660 family protein [Cytophagaceae bacterium]